MRPKFFHIENARSWQVYGVMVVALVLVVGALAWLLARNAERDLRQQFLESVELIARSLPLEEIRALEGTPRDSEAVVYQRLKAQFEIVQQHLTHCRFVYLVGRRADGRVFFFLDGEPAHSPNYRPPGQIFEEAPAGFHGVFQRWTPMTVGPFTDRWGTWVSALVPVPAGRKDGVLVVFGADMDIEVRKRQVFQKVLIPATLFTMLILVLLGGSIAVFYRRLRIRPEEQGWMYHMETALTLLLGLVFTGLAAWLLHQGESRNRQLVFQNYVALRVGALAQALQEVVNTELEGLARFFEGSEKVTWEEFQHYAGFLTRKSAVHTWGWVPVVPAAEKGAFEEEMRREGLVDFAIWELNAQGQRQPAMGREVFYPVTYLMPWTNNQRAVGFDAGSEPMRRRTLQAAELSGLPTATPPLRLVHEPAQQTSIIFYRPVFAPQPPKKLLGFGLTALRLDNFFKEVVGDEMVPMEWQVLDTNARPQRVAVFPPDFEPASICLSNSCPIMGAGQTYLVTAYAGESFDQLYPKRAGFQAVVGGVLLSMALAAIVALVRQRESQLEVAVAERTAALKESEETFRKLFEESSDPILLLQDGRYVSCNQAALNILGASDLNRIVGASLLDISPPQQPDGRASAEAAKEYLERAERKGLCRFEWTARRFDGKLLILDVSLMPIMLRGRKYLYSTWRDITEYKAAEEQKQRLQAQLVQAQKVESIGRLAGGVAHDFNNMLTVILGQVEQLEEELGFGHPAQESLKEIREAAERSTELTRRLLGFARQQTIQPVVLSLNARVGDLLKMLRRLVGEDIKMAWLPGENLWPVKIDPVQLEQVLINLCVNARDAIADVGKVTIETRNVVVSEEVAARHGDCTPGDYVMLEVADTGCGMDEQTLGHIFEPFFTTKDVGKGTGLGLSMVYGVLRQNRGFIEVESHPGQGSRFRLYFPRYREAPAPAAAEPAPRQPIVPGRETVLVVEDEPSVGRLTKTMLQRLGYQVLLVQTPEEALRVAQEEQQRLDVLLTDVVMPGMNGRELFKKMTAYQPRLKCLFMSAYTDDVIAERGVVDKRVNFIGKPFTFHQLSVKLREVLASEPPQGNSA